MIKKLLVLLVLCIAGAVAYDHGRTLSEADVRAYYGEQLQAYRRSDAEALCETMAKDFSLRLVARVGGASERSTMDKAAACEQLKETMRLMDVVAEQSRGLLSIDVAYDIRSIRISPDRRRATVEVTSTAKVGERLIARSRSSEELSRAFWRIRSHGGESQAWAYGG